MVYPYYCNGYFFNPPYAQAYNPNHPCNPQEQQYLQWSPWQYYNLNYPKVNQTYSPQPIHVHFLGDAYTQQVSKDFPDLHPILARDTTLVKYDVRHSPRENIPSAIYERHKREIATRCPVFTMRLISKDFPWTIEIDMQKEAVKSSYGRSTSYAINVADVWKAIYNALQEPLLESEWALLMDSSWLERDSRRRGIEQAAQKRVGKSPVVRRVDWLGEKAVFRGLVKDDNFARHRMMPGMKWSADTWVVRFDKK